MSTVAPIFSAKADKLAEVLQDILAAFPTSQYLAFYCQSPLIRQGVENELIALGHPATPITEALRLLAKNSEHLQPHLLCYGHPRPWTAEEPPYATTRYIELHVTQEGTTLRFQVIPKEEFPW